MTKATINVVLLLLFATTCFAEIARADGKPKRVSLLEVLILPERYESKEIVSVGYISFGSPFPQIFVYKTDKDLNRLSHMVLPYFLWETPRERFTSCVEGYAEIQGYVQMKNLSPLGEFMSISRVVEINTITLNEEDGSVTFTPCYRAADYED